MEIFEYSAAHRQQCLEMYDSNTPHFFAPIERPLFISWLDDLEKGKMRRDAAIFNYVAFECSDALACGGFYVTGDQRARMAWGMVHKDLHRRGIGRELLNFRIRRIRELFPYSSIALDTTQYSYGFFEKMGFVLTGITPDHYAPGMDRYDMDFRGDKIVL